MSNNEVTYGFVNENTVLIGHAVFVDGDLETIERVRKEYDAVFSYKVQDLTKEILTVGTAYWNGSRFVLPSPYTTWVFNDESNSWEPPIPMPENIPTKYFWSQETEQWEVNPIPASPFSSWVFDEALFVWKAPTPVPDSGYWTWDEPSVSWVERDH
jgi:hypothetical protein